MERGNYFILRLIASFELALIYILALLIGNYNKEIVIDNTTTYKEEIEEIEKEIAIYRNVIEETNKLKEEYTDNIAKLEQMIVNKETNAKIAYLTFDDGPYDLTQKYLDILKSNNVRATFFTLGKTKYENTYKK